MPFIFRNVAIGRFAPAGQQVRVIVKRSGLRADETVTNAQSLSITGERNGGTIEFKGLALPSMKKSIVRYHVAPQYTHYYFIIENQTIYSLNAVTLDAARALARASNNQRLLNLLP
jgi:hypothetical protein